MRVAVLGAGAWGTAVAIHIARKWRVRLWARNASQLVAMREQGSNERYLPGHAFPSLLEIADDPDDCARWAGEDGLIVLAGPTAGLRGSLEQLAPLISAKQVAAPVVWLCKGLEAGSGLLPSQVADSIVAGHPHGVVSGPSFAQEVAAGLPAALVVAGNDPVVSARVADAFHHNRMRIYFSADMTGVELAGAMKNIMAIAAGICDGLKLGANARAAMITRGLAEIARLGQALGGKSETFMGLAGMGDLVLTCATDLSRNRQVGLRLAGSETLRQIVDSLGHVAEGVPCAREAVRLAAELGVDMPIAESVNDIIDGRVQPKEAVSELLARDPIQE